MSNISRMKATYLLAAATVAAAVAFALWRGPSGLDRWKAEMAAQGEKFTYRELAPRFSPAVTNFHQNLAAAARQLQLGPVYPGSIAMMKEQSPGYASVAWKQPAPLDTESPSSNTWTHFTAQMDRNAEPLRAISDLLPRWPGGLSFDPEAPVTSPSHNLVLVRQSAYAFSGAVILELHRGRLDAALTNIHALVALARLFDESGTLVERMIGVAILDLALNTTWEALQAPGWDEAALAALQARLEPCDLLPALARTAEMERAFGLAYYDYARKLRRDHYATFRDIGINSTSALAQGVNASGIKPLWQKAWSKQDELLYLQTMQPVVVATRAAVTNRSWPALRVAMRAATTSRVAQQSALNQFRYPMKDEVIVNWEKAPLNLMRTETRRQLTVTALALRRWQSRHGTYPERLGQLVPELLRSLPWDSMDGGTLRYRPEAPDSFTLYSVGENGRDDGGSGDDLVWLRPAL